MQAQNERVLFLSVIEAAMEDAKETNVRVRQAALEWLMQDQADFPRICELAGLDSAYVRKNLASRLSSSPSVQSYRHHIVTKTTASLKVGVPDGI